MIRNKIGLEFEFLLRDKDGNLVFPEDFGFECDEFIILGEARAEAGKNPEETLANFYNTYYSVKWRAEAKGLTLDLTGYAEIPNDFSAEIMRRMRLKEISQSKNIYEDVDILKMNDSVIKKGKVVGKYISTGLHVHFSSTITKHLRCSVQIPVYERVVSMGVAIPVEIYTKTDKSTLSEEAVENTVSRITMPVVRELTKNFDNTILPKHKLGVDLKFRTPGFYEAKHYGFEYRSLPFYTGMLAEGMEEVVLFAFAQLNSLKI